MATVSFCKVKGSGAFFTRS